MNNQYLLIKLNGNWIERAQTKKLIEFMLAGVDAWFDVIDDEKSVVNLGCSQAIEREMYFKNKDFVDFTKEKIAVHFGKTLLKNGLIRFKESKERHFVKLEGEITVIAEKGGETDA